LKIFFKKFLYFNFSSTRKNILKPQKGHISVLAATSVSLATKLLEDELCKNMGKYLVRAANTSFSIKDLNRMEMMILTKFDWKIEEATCMDFLFNFLDFSTLGKRY
jgi:hypothetical protein